MKIVETTTRTCVAADGREFTDMDNCLRYERRAERRAADWHAAVVGKIGEYREDELLIGNGVARVAALPYTAPWFSPFGVCLIKISDLRRNQAGKVEFQLAAEDGNPYDNGAVWVAADRFYEEWPH